MASRAPDITGQVFARLTVISRATNYQKNTRTYAQWFCQCICGNTSIVRADQLRNGRTKSCGCLFKEAQIRSGKRNGKLIKHGGSKTRTYISWKSMRQRCNDSHATGYEYYGGRGIQVCIAWDDYAIFLQDMGVRPDDTSLDRIDPNGHYEPSNCRWSTRKAQRANRRDSHGA